MKKWMWIGCLVAGLGLGWGGGQELEAQDGRDKLRLFFDCKAMTMACFDPNFYRREITWVHWVLDREDADVHLLVTAQRAGGGMSFEFAFIGLGDFEGQDHNLTGFSSGTDTRDEQREVLASKMKMGLVPYAAETAEGDLLSVVYQVPELPVDGAPVEQTPENDPWNL